MFLPSQISQAAETVLVMTEWFVRMFRLLVPVSVVVLVHRVWLETDRHVLLSDIWETCKGDMDKIREPVTLRSNYECDVTVVKTPLKQIPTKCLKQLESKCKIINKT